MLDALGKEVRAENPSCSLIIPEMAPVFGSVMLAMDRMGIPVTDEIRDNFANYGG